MTSTSACSITVCFAGRRLYCDGRQSTPHRPADRGDADMFQTDLIASALCDEQQWSTLDGDSLVKLYDDTIATLLDRQPLQTEDFYKDIGGYVDKWFANSEYRQGSQ